MIKVRIEFRERWNSNKEWIHFGPPEQLYSSIDVLGETVQRLTSTNPNFMFQYVILEDEGRPFEPRFYYRLQCSSKRNVQHIWMPFVDSPLIWKPSEAERAVEKLEQTNPDFEFKLEQGRETR